MKLNILLAACNGESFIKDQIDSLFSQTFTEWHLIMRDDGSHDRTLEILQAYQQRFPDKITLIHDDRKGLGPCLNFGELLKHADADFVMFCDQDDVWLPRKIEISMDKMLSMSSQTQNDQTPLLVFTDLTVVDQSLHVLSESFWDHKKSNPRNTTLNRLLVQNVATGCTMLMNRALCAKAVPVPPRAVVHDWWVILVASIFGRIESIATPTVLYRQHSKNYLGARKWDPPKSVKLFFSPHARHIEYDRFINVKNKSQQQALCLYEQYHDCLNDPEKAMLIQRFANLNAMNWIKKRQFLLQNRLIYGDWFRTVAQMLFY